MTSEQYCEIIGYICDEELERMREFVEAIEDKSFCPNNCSYLVGQEAYIPTFEALSKAYEDKNRNAKIDILDLRSENEKTYETLRDIILEL